MTEKKKSGAAMHIIGAVLCVVFGFFLVCNIIIIVKGTLHPETPPTVLGVAPMVVLSGSMSGTAEDHIEVGDLIFTKQADIDELKVGDVVAFMDGSIVVTHRGIRHQGRRQQHRGRAYQRRPDHRPVQRPYSQGGRLRAVPAKAAGHGDLHRRAGVRLRGVGYPAPPPGDPRR